MGQTCCKLCGMSSRSLSTPGWIGRHIAATLHAAFTDAYSGSQDDLAAAIGISQSQVSALLSGARVINVDQLKALCDEMGLSSAAVLDDAERGWRLAQSPSD